MLQNNLRNSQAGNVFVIILAGVFLFGALMFTFSRSAQKGSGNLTKQQAKIAAQEILNYARAVEGAVDRVRRNGCSESEISFDNAVVSGYSNPNAPPDGSCDIYGSNGGKLTWATPPDNASIEDNQYYISAAHAVYGLGSSSTATFCISEADPSKCAELVIAVRKVREEICREINSLLLGDANIPVNSGGPNYASKFTGTYYATHAASVQPIATRCTQRPTTAPFYYYFYYTLLAR